MASTARGGGGDGVIHAVVAPQFHGLLGGALADGAVQARDGRGLRQLRTAADGVDDDPVAVLVLADGRLRLGVVGRGEEGLDVGADGGLHVGLFGGHALGHRAHVQNRFGGVDAEGVVGAYAHVAYGYARRLCRGGQAEHQAEG